MNNAQSRGVSLVVGATGFVGRHVMRAFERKGHRVIGTSRSLVKAAQQAPQHEFRLVDLDDEATVSAALVGVETAVYLYHGMRDGAGYQARELAAAKLFSTCAAKRGGGEDNLSRRCASAK